ncbi:putative membrane-bound dehydrogenase domain-containing protein [Prosthecobacter debontii]|uniref:Putative membrane-bound dehydrogenase domain-containing protein n=1 Tax=Prosthecobacter debontii TaxID=48467 RepID=A0A1T4WKM7_9BACT|nr:PVC-type heme-binding CxxCH protein [Prosthecobacter debontii]SKA77916.1 putative membrane-bound dehydrogenase domain-containing protein [Prosthecobacter debontii]
MKSSLFTFLAALALSLPLQAQVEFQPGDSIAILGNALPDRSQHFGWLETMLVQANADKDLTFRNLAFSGDEVQTWHRVDGFGTRDEWLAKVKADVIFAFYGNNESFKGYDGLDAFKKNLDAFLKETKAKNYNGKGSPRIVLFSPIALEKLADPSLPPVEEKNTNLQNYTAAMSDVAAANGVAFVDLFAVSQKAYGQKPLTLNGLLLTEAGDKVVAEAAYKALTGKEAAEVNDKLRHAVVEKNWEWHQRYRSVDGYNVYGGRSGLAYQAGVGGFKQNEKTPEKPYISNYQVMQEEMTQRDVKTANRDMRVWAIAKGGDLVVKDDNLPAVEKVPTNMPDPKEGKEFNKVPMTGMTFTEDGLVAIPDAKEKLKDIQVHSGMKIQLFADEKKFPELVNPVAMQWDTKGRLWVSAWLNYPERTPTSPKGDSLLIFEDTNGDGEADKMTTFADDLNCPTGFQIYKDGVIVMQSPSLVYIADTDGDGKADKRERILTGLCAADSHHETCYLSYDNGGAIYPSDGVFHRTQVETIYGVVRNTNGAIYRYDLNRQELQRFTTDATVNPHGKIWDRWGNAYFTDATGNVNTFAEASSCYLPREGGGSAKMKPFWDRPARPSPGNGIISSRHFPEEFQNNFLNCNVISFQGIWRVKLSQEGGGMKGETVEDLVKADPAVYPTFRPSCVNVGPDGALYFCDWSNAIIGHMQHHLRDPNRDHKHGRIYKVTYEGRPLLKPKKIDGEPIEKLLDLLKEWEDGTRQLAKVELAKHDHSKVAAAAKKWAAALDKNDPEYEHHRLEALWTHQWVDVVDVELLKQVLASPDPRARAAATRVLCYWKDRVPGALDLLKVSVNDEDPRVRMQGVRALSFYQPTPEAEKALEIAYDALKYPMDYYTEHVFGECRRGLQSVVKTKLLPKDPQALAEFISKASDADLKGLPDVEPVLIEKLTRPKLPADVRANALTELVKLTGNDRTLEIVKILQRIDAAGGRLNATAEEIGKILVLELQGHLQRHRLAIQDLALKGTQEPVIRSASAALVITDSTPDEVWKSATPKGRLALLESIALIPSTKLSLRAKFQPHLQALLEDSKTDAKTLRAVLAALPLMSPAKAKENFDLVAKYLIEGNERSTAARSLIKFPKAVWNAGQAKPITDSVLAYANTVPAGDRSKQAYVEIITAAKEMAALQGAASEAVLKELRSVSVDVFIIHTVHEQLRFDTTQLTVRAGKPFEVIFENDDVMPHNFVIVPPGKHMEIGNAAMTMTPDKLDKQGRAYMPPVFEKDIIAATKLLEPGQKDQLKVKAPAQPGDYEFVCTFPGHALVMWGTLKVTKD